MSSWGGIGQPSNDLTLEGFISTIVPPQYQRRHWRMRLRAWWHRIASGGFFPSAVAAGVGGSSAIVLQAAEVRYTSAWCDASGPLDQLCEVPVDTSVSIQAGVAFGILGTVGIVFSILLVSLQLVSGQFSPRLVQASFRDKKSKALVAILVMVFVFSMTALIATLVHAGEGGAAGLNTAVVGLAGVVAGVALAMMLYGVAQRQYTGTYPRPRSRQDYRHDCYWHQTTAGTARLVPVVPDVPASVLEDVRTLPEATPTST